MFNMVSHLPNVLSCFRLVVACLFPFVPQNYWIWFIIVGGGSDFLDGWVARRWNVTSWKGRVLDAVADKVFVLSVLCTFVLTGKLHIWAVPAVLIRDLVVVVIALYTQCSRAWDTFRRIESRNSGKIATAGQFLLLVTVAVVPFMLLPVLAVAILLSMSAGIDYGLQFLHAVRHRAEPSR